MLINKKTDEGDASKEELLSLSGELIFEGLSAFPDNLYKSFHFKLMELSSMPKKKKLKPDGYGMPALMSSFRSSS